MEIHEKYNGGIILCFSDIFLSDCVTIVKTQLKGDRIMKGEA